MLSVRLDSENVHLLDEETWSQVKKDHEEACEIMKQKWILCEREKYIHSKQQYLTEGKRWLEEELKNMTREYSIDNQDSNINQKSKERVGEWLLNNKKKSRSNKNKRKQDKKRKSSKVKDRGDKGTKGKIGG